MNVQPAITAIRQEEKPFDFLKVILEFKSLILLTILASFLAALVYLFFSHPLYTAKATLFIYGDRFSPGLITMWTPAPSYQYVNTVAEDSMMALLESDKLAENVLEGLKLKIHQGLLSTTQDPLIKEISKSSIQQHDSIDLLKSKVKFSLHNRLLTIEAETQDSNLSAEIANDYLEGLNSLLISYSRGEIRFLSEKMKEAKTELLKAQDTLTRFQEKNKLLGVDDQAKSFVTSQADLEKSLILLKIDLEENQKLAQSSGSLQELVKLEGERTGLQAKIAALTHSIQAMNEKLSHFPESALQFANLSRDLKAKEVIYEHLMDEYAAATFHVKESEIFPYWILDKAYPPKARSWPHYRTSLLLAIFLGLSFGMFLAFVIDSWKTYRKDRIASWN